MECADEKSGNPLTGLPQTQAELDVANVAEVCRFFVQGRCHFGEKCRLSHSTSEFTNCTAAEMEEQGSKKRKTRKKSGKTDKDKDREKKELQESEKKPRMRTADEVISRILWDSSVDPADFVVGHLERFMGLMERPFSDFSWDTQVCDCDYSEELTIPRHRIQYFSYKGQRLWDRESRTDRVFGSTGQTVLAPFDQEDPSQESASPDTTQEEEELQTEKNGILNGTVSGAEDATECGATGPNVEDFEDAGLVQKAEGLSVSPKDEQIASMKEWKDGWEKEDEQGEETQPVPSISQEPRNGRPSRRPTHFICFRVDSPAALYFFQRVQKKVLTHLPQSQEFWVNPATLHITLSLLVLQSPAEVQAAAELLRSIVKNMYKPVSVFLPPKLKHFNGRILFVPPQPIPDIQSLNTPIQEAFREKGWLHRYSKCPSYHLTLAKEKGEELQRMFEDVGIIKLPKDINFGKLQVEKLYMCVNGATKTESGFYQTVCTVQLPEV